MKTFLSYWFWPNPGNVYYEDSQVLVALGIGASFIVVSIILRFWRKRLANPVTKKLSRTWSLALVWFGIVAIVLTVSRVESVLFLSMRILWVVWALVIAVYIVVQVLQFRLRHYTVLAKDHIEDERDKYLPTQKRKR